MNGKNIASEHDCVRGMNEAMITPARSLWGHTGLIFYICIMFALVSYCTQLVIEPKAAPLLMEVWEWAWRIWLPFGCLAIGLSSFIYGGGGFFWGVIYYGGFACMAIFL